MIWQDTTAHEKAIEGRSAFSLKVSCHLHRICYRECFVKCNIKLRYLVASCIMAAFWIVGIEVGAVVDCSDNLLTVPRKP